MDIKLNATKSERYIKDLGEASALVACDIKLLRLERDQNNSFYWFVFPTGDSEQVSASYWSDELSVPARKYSMAIKSLKDKLFSQRTFL